MAKYYGVHAVIKCGQNIGNIRNTERRELCIGQDEALIGIVSDGINLIAPDLTNNFQYNECYEAYKRGEFVAILFYKVKKSSLETCPDEGTINIEHFKRDRDFYGALLGI